jgi:hypothetical protein
MDGRFWILDCTANKMTVGMTKGTRHISPATKMIAIPVRMLSPMRQLAKHKTADYRYHIGEALPNPFPRIDTQSTVL